MKKVKKHVVDIGVHTIDEFFARGREVAKKADAGLPIEPVHSIWFGDPKDLSKFLSETKFDLINTLRQKEHTVKELEKRLNRTRAALMKDISQLEKAGLVTCRLKKNPGHGVEKAVKATSKEPVTFMLKF